MDGELLETPLARELRLIREDVTALRKWQENHDHNHHGYISRVKENLPMVALYALAYGVLNLIG